ncbi:MAG: hypothetical protein ACYC9P_05570 [Rudaea sp.]
MRAAIFFLVLVGISSAQSPTPTQNPTDMQQKLLRYNAQMHACRSNSRKCQDVCEKANALKDAAEDLAACAARHDYSDDCSTEAADASDAADEYESSVSDADNDCE